MQIIADLAVLRGLGSNSNFQVCADRPIFWH